MDAHLREAWKDILRWLLYNDGYIPYDDPSNDRLFLALVDIRRAVACGCKTLDEVIDFLRIESEGWFWEEQVLLRAEIAKLLRNGKEGLKGKVCRASYGDVQA